MKHVGSFKSSRWGMVDVLLSTYAEGQTAVKLTIANGEPIAVLSVNMYKPECSQDSKDLPVDCFYVKTWSENAEIYKEAFASGLFIGRGDIPNARSGFVVAPVWQIKP